MVPAPSDATRTRLLEVAGPLFAARGFRDTGIKEICAAARCNVASVNYHFGSKLGFYGAVLAHAHQRAFVGSTMPVPAAGADPQQTLATWLRWWIGSMLHPDRPTWVQTLLAREIVDPTPALDAMVERSIRPMHGRLTTMVKRILPPRTKPAKLRDAVNSIIGQVLIYKHASAVLERLGAMPEETAAGLDRLIDHVVTFTLGGLAALAKPSSPTTRRRSAR
ncbi:MAG: CerR family C-terminal domain-containing protein [Planctomycetes bacterium]|nr:CerR family C-terminal domain-containing protein [Planctomycetota bacterium]